jgi:anti-sigma regulatory factor (Ser/Thr protein kinase)
MHATIGLRTTLPARVGSLRGARNAVAEVAAAFGAAPAVVDDVRLCVGEAFANAVRHAYAGGTGAVDVAAEGRGEELVVVVRDRGVGMRAARRNGAGYGLRIIEELTLRHDIATAPRAGTEVRMVFALDGPSVTRRADAA